MENNSGAYEMLKETTLKLDQIKELNKEIHTALDVIETRRKKKHTADDSLKEVADSDQELKNVERETAEGCIEDAQAPDNKCSEETLPEDSQSTTKVKGILKAPKKGSKDSYGFKERLDLQFNHVMYGSKLKRTAVEMNQDNRLCQEFGLEPNIGNIYETRRPPLSDTTNERTVETAVNNQFKKRVTLYERENNVSKTSTSNEKENTSSRRPSKNHSEAPSGSTAVEVQSKVKMKDQQTEDRKEKTQKQSDMTIEISRKSDGTEAQQFQNKQMEIIMEAIKNRGNPLQLSRDMWINTIADLTNGDDEEKQEMRQALGAFIDAFFGKESIVNIGEFFNMTREKFIDNLLEMYSVDESSSEEEKRQAAEQMANVMFNEDGSFDFMKCLQEGGQMMNFGNPQLQAAIDQMSSTVQTSETGTTSTTDQASATSQTYATSQISATRTRYKSSDNDTKNKSSNSIYQQSAEALTGAVNSSEIGDDDSEVERIDIDPDVWVQYANDEVKKGKVAQDVRESGMDTVICLDTSHSMRGFAWEQATLFIKKFVEGIQNTTLMDASYEHIALVTYGSETRVQQHLTCDYVEIIRKLERLKPSGTSPMYAGLQMVHAAIIGAGMVFKCNDYRMYPRVFLITDGKFTPAGMISGPDRYQPDLLHQEQLPILQVVKEIHDKFHVNFNPVPVGECDTSILDTIVHLSKGKMVSPEDWRMQSRVFKNYLATAKLCGGPFFKMLAPQLRPMMLDSLNGSPEDKIQMEEFLRTHTVEDDSNDSDFETDDLPPLGSRIRGHKPGSTILADSNEALGTVTKHFSDGHIGITWDEVNEDGKLREKRLYQAGARSVIVVDEPRVLNDQMIAEGCRVKRGKDWSYADQDGGEGNLGSVFIVLPSGIVKVRWDNGHKNTYKYGAEGKFDIEIVEQRKIKEPKAVHTDKTTDIKDDLTEEMRVQKMNERNRPAYDVEITKTTYGATSRFQGENVDKNSKNRNNVSPNQTVYSPDKSTTDENYDSRHAVEINRKNTRNSTASSVGQSNEHTSDNTGARRKKSKPLDESTEAKVEWTWHDGETWRIYPPHIIKKIESGYKRNPKGSTVILLDDITYRVVFPRMEKINIETKEKFSVARKI